MGATLLSVNVLSKDGMQARSFEANSGQKWIWSVAGVEQSTERLEGLYSLTGYEV